MQNKRIPYTYVIIHKETGLFYYGSQYHKKANPKDLWVTYFTSSNTIKKMIEFYGKDAFIYKVRKIFECPHKCVEYENKVIRRIIKNKKCLNGHCGFGVVDSNKGRRIKNPSTGLSSYDIGGAKAKDTKLNDIDENGLNSFERAGLKVSQFLQNNKEVLVERTNKMLCAKLNDIDENGLNSFERAGLKRSGDNSSSKRTEVKEKISKGVLNWIKNNPDKVEENRKKMINALLQKDENGLNYHDRHSLYMLENNPTSNSTWINNGLSNKRIKENEPIPEGWLVGRLSFKMTRTEKVCPHCNKIGRGPNMTRYHFDNCKFKN